MRNIVPVARRGGNFFFILDGNGDFDVDVLQGSTLFCNLLVNFDGNVDLDGNLCGNGDPTFFQDLHFDGDVNHVPFFDLMGHFNFDLLVYEGRVIVFLFNIDDIRYLFSNCLKAGLWLFDFDRDLNHGGHFNRHHFYIILRHLDLFRPLDHLLFSGGEHAWRTRARGVAAGAVYFTVAGAFLLIAGTLFVRHV